MTICFGIGLIGFGTYVATNRAFVYLWVGSEQFLGEGITLLIAVGLLLMVITQFLSSFIISTGDITYPSLLVFLEAVVRLVFMSSLLYSFGLAGLPLGMLMSCAIFGLIYYKRLDEKMSLLFFQDWNWLRSALVLVTLLSIGIFAAQQVPILETWLTFGAYFLFVALILTFSSFSFNPALRSLFAALPTRFFKKQTIN
jgi:hypothetical protein